MALGLGAAHADETAFPVFKINAIRNVFEQGIQKLSRLLGVFVAIGNALLWLGCLAISWIHWLEEVRQAFWLGSDKGKPERLLFLRRGNYSLIHTCTESTFFGGILPCYYGVFPSTGDHGP